MEKSTTPRHQPTVMPIKKRLSTSGSSKIKRTRPPPRKAEKNEQRKTQR